MVKVIKSGNSKEFVAVCDRCGCEFSYTWQDLMSYQDITSSTSLSFHGSPVEYVNCPECGKRHIHTAQRPYNPIPSITLYSNADPDNAIDCSTCKFGKASEHDKPYIGDSPCTYCAKNRVRASTSSNMSTKQPHISINSDDAVVFASDEGIIM